MKLHSLTFLTTLLGSGLAKVSELKMVKRTKPLQSFPLLPQVTDCSVKGPARKLADFMRLVENRELLAPCRYMMNQTYTADLKEWMKTGNVETRSGAASAEYLQEGHFRFRLDIRRGVAAYISSISIEQEGRGRNCSSFLLIRQNKNEPEPRGSTPVMEALDDGMPIWTPKHVNQIKPGLYFLEVPSACLNNPKKLTAEIQYSYEYAGSQLREIRGSGQIVRLGTSCNLHNQRRRIMTSKKYRKAVQNIFGSCEHRYERNYLWIVPSSHMYNNGDKVVVAAPLALYEPMLGDQRREIGNLRLQQVWGNTCNDIVAYALAKAPHDLPSITFTRTKFIQDEKVFDVTVLPQIRDTEYTVYFELPKDCYVYNPAVEVQYQDRNTDQTVAI